MSPATVLVARYIESFGGSYLWGAEVVCRLAEIQLLEKEKRYLSLTPDSIETARVVWFGSWIDSGRRVL